MRVICLGGCEMKQSKDVIEAIKTLYALMASVAARKAMDCVALNAVTNADTWAKDHARWLPAAGSRATRWSYRKPSL